MRKVIWGVVLGLAMIPCSAARGAGIGVAEAQAIRQVALDYVEGWYEADVERMQRALHADLVKRYPVSSCILIVLGLFLWIVFHISAISGGWMSWGFTYNV